MKKLALAIMVVLAASLFIVSCAKKEEAPATPAADSTAVKVDTAAVTTAPADSVKK